MRLHILRATLPDPSPGAAWSYFGFPSNMMPKDRKGEIINVWVRDPRIQKDDWHSYLDYEVCIQTNSMCFTLKTSCVRRRFREFVWLRQKLQNNAILIDLPELPPKSPFFNISNAQTVEQRVRGLQDFLNKVMQCPVLLSDSRLHLFLQSHLPPDEIEACALGQTKYTVLEAIHKFASSNRRFPVEEEEKTNHLRVHPLKSDTQVVPRPSVDAS